MSAVAAEDLERGPWLDELVYIWKRDGELDPEVVKVEGRNPTSALYPYFTHNGKEALDKLNRIEAGRLIRRAQVLIEVEGGEVRRVRAFLHTADKQYQPSGPALSRKRMREEILERMKLDIQILTNRYDKYSAISEVSDALLQLRRWLKDHGG